jgi:hypothetical protein
LTGWSGSGSLETSGQQISERMVRHDRGHRLPFRKSTVLWRSNGGRLSLGTLIAKRKRKNRRRASPIGNLRAAKNNVQTTSCERSDARTKFALSCHHAVLRPEEVCSSRDGTSVETGAGNALIGAYLPNGTCPRKSCSSPLPPLLLGRINGHRRTGLVGPARAQPPTTASHVGTVCLQRRIN